MIEPSLDTHLTLPHEHKKHRPFYSTKTFRLLCMLSLTFVYFIVELVVGNITNSLALVADAFHMLSDLIALLIALLAVRISKRRSDINTYGWVRAEVVGANINTVFLLALCLTIVFDVIKRYIQPEPITNATLLLIVGCIGLGINIIGLFLFQGFHGHSHGNRKDAHNHQVDHGHSHENRKDVHNHQVDSKSESKTKTNNETGSGKRAKESVVVIDHENHQINQKATTTNGDDDITLVESIQAPGEFKRHSTRALEEVS